MFKLKVSEQHFSQTLGDYLTKTHKWFSPCDYFKRHTVTQYRFHWETQWNSNTTFPPEPWVSQSAGCIPAVVTNPFSNRGPEWNTVTWHSWNNQKQTAGVVQERSVSLQIWASSKNACTTSWFSARLLCYSYYKTFCSTLSCFKIFTVGPLKLANKDDCFWIVSLWCFCEVRGVRQAESG